MTTQHLELADRVMGWVVALSGAALVISAASAILAVLSTVK